MARRSSTCPVVVVGGYDWNPGVNHTCVQTVRELARTRPVLYLYTEARGAIAERVWALTQVRPARDLVRTLVRVKPRHDAGRVWIAPLRGVSTVLPLGFPEPIRQHNVRIFGHAIRSWLAEQGADRCVLVFYWWFLPEIVDDIPHTLAVYDCAEEHAEYPGSRLPADVVRRVEGRLIDRVDRTYVVASGLLASREGPGRDVRLLPNGFDTQLFEEACGIARSGPGPLDAITGTVVGFVGGMGGRVDADLVREIARERPTWTIVLISPDARSAIPGIEAMPNVRLLGAVPYPEMLRLIARFDVAFIPFRDTEFTRGNSFAKLLDFFAHGTPVVAAPLPDTRTVAAEHADLIRLPESRAEWLLALEEAAAEPHDSPARAARRAFVAHRSVTRRVEQMIGSS